MVHLLFIHFRLVFWREEGERERRGREGGREGGRERGWGGRRESERVKARGRERGTKVKEGEHVRA